MEPAKLIIIRGNSGSGKSSIAKALRLKMVEAGVKVALVEQDYIRRTMLKEKDMSDGDNIDLIEQVVMFSLNRGYSVVLEGILYFPNYGKMLKRLFDSCGSCHVYYLDVPFDETLRRHATKPNAHEFGEAELRKWWHESDLTHFPGEQLIPAGYCLEESVQFLGREAGFPF
jgi:adenylylsulfate kinase-like enzyme